ncbi:MULTISPECIES: hypothetical protein [Aquimarina]|uniref:Uncharacterized protein n=1 Tax=Aquimarina algicola TaxID=2589995 RepID=A0A504JK89_9FLAO|nr:MULTISPECIES: hypothetical protein [Aquimarina]TPN87159.1 hypothetical protein FHK87_06095 [Aquimarina algicola]
MTLYNYTVKDESKDAIVESGVGELFDLETVIPIEILSILELYEDEEGVITIKVRAGDFSYDINKIRSISA